MINYLLRRIAQAIVVVVLVTVVTFLLLHILPGGPAHAMLSKDSTPQQVAAFNHEMGYDQPLLSQYIIWMRGLAVGNFGFSYALNEPVGRLIAATLPRTVLLMLLATIVSVAASVFIGSLQATRRNTVTDHSITAMSFLLYATPTFFLGLVLIMLFAIYLHILPPEAPQSESVLEILGEPLGLLLPVVTLAVVPTVVFARYSRSSVIDNLQEDYVRAARAKGLTERQVLWNHVLRNSLLPMTTLLGFSIPQILSGALVVEQLFNYPGMGLLFWNATLAKDYPTLLAEVLIVGVATVVGTLLADLTYAFLDPRIRYVNE